MSRRGILTFVIVVDVLALIGFSLTVGQDVGDNRIGLFLLATLVALAGATPVRIPALKTTVSATDPFVFTALAAYGPMTACIVGAAGVLGSAVGRDANRKPLHFAFNLGNVVSSVAVASWFYLLTGGRPGGGVYEQIWPLVASTTVYFMLNTGLVTSAIVIDTRRSFWPTWRESGLWTAVSAYAGLTLSAGLLIALDLVGPSGLALGIPPCWLLAAFYRTHKERQEAQQSRIQEIEFLNTELEDKVTERTVELQTALTHIEQTNAQLRVSNERLKEANRTKSEFLANVSHELRTPLNAIIGFSDLLRDQKIGRLNGEQQEFANDIHDSGNHLLRLINDILDLSKVEAGKMECRREEFDLRRAIREAVAMVRPQAAQGELSLRVDCAEDLHAVCLDPRMFRQILINLLGNAVKFTPHGGSVAVAGRREGTDLVVTVSDTGIGIPSDDLEKIFDEFYQVDGSFARNYGGTGLGLALVRRMVELQSGSIAAASVPGDGSTFTCRFAECVVEGRTAAEDKPVQTACPMTSPGGRTVMVVEDNAVNRKLARNVLRSRGFEVFEACSGEEALRMLRGRPTDIVLMDLQLPGMDGFEVTRRLKSDPLTADLPVVALTANEHGDDESRAREAGCVGYITKPIRLSQFPGQVESYL